jgi:hypothetical protein
MHQNGAILWDEIQSYKHRWIVDNHTPFGKLASNPEFSDTAFILGTTVLNEHANPILLFETLSGKRKAFVNVFHFSVPRIDGEYWLAIDRVDRAYLSIHNRERIIADANFKNPRDESIRQLNAIRSVMRMCIMWMLYKRAGFRVGSSLLQAIRGLVPQCFKNYLWSGKIATLCFARLLIDSHQARNRFESKGSMNGFMDTGLIKDALFFNAGILSGDRAVGRMARYCGIRVKTRLEAAGRNHSKIKAEHIP